MLIKYVLLRLLWNALLALIHIDLAARFLANKALVNQQSIGLDFLQFLSFAFGARNDPWGWLWAFSLLFGVVSLGLVERVYPLSCSIFARVDGLFARDDRWFASWCLNGHSVLDPTCALFTNRDVRDNAFISNNIPVWHVQRCPWSWPATRDWLLGSHT